MPTSKKVGGGALACRLGCNARGGDDPRHDVFCPIVVESFHLGQVGDRETSTLLYCLPTCMGDTVTHAVWHYVLCRSVACISHRWNVASRAVAHTVLVSEFRGLVTRALGLRAQCVRDQVLGWR